MREDYQLLIDGNEMRGLHTLAFTPDNLVRIGRAYAELLREIYVHPHDSPYRVVLGFDARESSQDLQNSLIRGLSAEGINVLNIGLAPSPLVYFAVDKLKADGGIVITGSHRASGWNGARFYIGREPLGDRWMRELASRSRRTPRRHLLPVKGQVTYLNMVPDYLRAMQREFEPVHAKTNGKAVHVVVSGANGVASLTAPQALIRAGCRVVKLGCCIDSISGNRSHNPSDPALLKELGSTTRAAKADFGVVFDGDGDRIRVVDHAGTPVRSDHLLQLFASHLAQRHPGLRIATDLRGTDLIEKTLEAGHGQVIYVPATHTAMMEAIRTGNIKVAGDSDGHYYFADRSIGFDDGTYAVLRLAELLANHRRESGAATTLRSLLPADEAFSAPEKVVPNRGELPLLNTFADILRQEKKAGKPIVSIQEDHFTAVRIRFDGGFGSLSIGRDDQSARLRYEGVTESSFQSIGNLLREALEKSLVASAPATAGRRALS